MKLKKAMKLYPIVKEDDHITPNYIFGDKSIAPVLGNEARYFNNLPGDTAEYTEKEAVAYLIEGAEKSPLLPVNLGLELTPKDAQFICNILYQAGYRPEKKKKNEL